MNVRTVVIALTVVATASVSSSVGGRRRTLSFAEKVAQADAIVVGKVAEIESKRYSLTFFERDSNGKQPVVTSFYDLAVLHPETVLKADSDSMINRADPSNPVGWMHMAFATPGQIGAFFSSGPAARKDDDRIWFLRRDLIFTGHHFIREVEEVSDAKIQEIKELIADEQARYVYSDINHSIFGSQLVLLQALNFQTSPVEREFLFSFYEGAKQQYPDFYDNYTFESYVDYLTSTDLVSTERGKYAITVHGRGFLEFLAESCKNDRNY